MKQRKSARNLVAAHPGNKNAQRHGAYSEDGRALAPRAREIADSLMAAPHTVPLDEIAAVEIGRLIALIEAIDEDLTRRGLTDRTGKARSLVDLRLRASGRLERWLREFGATPASRVEWVERVARGETLASIVRDEVAEGARLLDDARRRGDLPAPERDTR